MLPGYNHNIRHGGLVFHVQSGVASNQSNTVLSEVFYRGSIICSRTCVCVEPDDDHVLKQTLQAQHRQAVKDLVKGKFDNTIKNTPGTDEFGFPREVPTAGQSQPQPQPTTQEVQQPDQPSTDARQSDDILDFAGLEHWPTWPLTDSVAEASASHAPDPQTQNPAAPQSQTSLGLKSESRSPRKKTVRSTLFVGIAAILLGFVAVSAGYGIATHNHPMSLIVSEQTSLVLEVLPVDATILVDGQEVSRRDNTDKVTVPVTAGEQIELEFRSNTAKFRQQFTAGSSGKHILRVDLTESTSSSSIAKQ